MKYSPFKIVSFVLFIIGVFLIGMEIVFINSATLDGLHGPAIFRLIFYVRYYLKSFIFFASIVLAIGLINFSYIIVKPESPQKAKSYIAISISFLFFSIYSVTLTNEFLRIELWSSSSLILEIAYLLAINTLVVAMFFRTKKREYIKILIFQYMLTLLYLLMNILGFETVLLRLLVQVLVVLTAFLGMFYVHYYRTKDTKESVDIFFYRQIFLITLIGKAIEFVSVLWFQIPQNLMELFLKGIPLIIAIRMLFEHVFNEMIIIRERHEKERNRLQFKNINVYEYVSEGVFSVSKNFRVNDTYTKACNMIFNMDISNMPMSELIYDRETSSELVQRIVEDLFLGKMKWEVGTELLPNKIIVNDKHFQIQYQKALDPEHGRINEIIIKMHDISDTVLLESQLLFERDKLALAITSMMNREELLTLVNEFIDYMNSLVISNVDIEEVLTILHTYKGNFGIFNFIHIVSSLHEFESKILREFQINQQDVEKILHDLYRDLEIITEVTGSSFFEDKVYLQANVNNLESVYNEVKKYFYDTEASLIIYIIQKIFNKSVRNILLFYGREARKKAMESGKNIKTIEVIGDDVFVDYNHYKYVLRSLVHVFNNCIDHGIEDEEERIFSGKPKYGEIQCQLHDYGNFFEISIKDDGRGVDTVKLKATLLEKKDVDDKEVELMTEEELKSHIFDQEVSTMKMVSVRSGRGVGLASVKTEVEKMGGEIRVISLMDFGTEVKVMLPKESEVLISYFSLPLLMDLYIEAFKIYIKSNNIITLPVNVVGLDSIDTMNEYSVKIPFSGPEEGYFFMSCNKETVWQMAKYFTEDRYLTEETFEEIKYEVLAESCNIIAGNSTSIFDLTQKYIDVDSPQCIEKNRFLDANELLHKWHMRYEEYDIILGLMSEE